MPNRIIKESIKRSPEIDRLSWFEEVVFYRLIVTADDYGRLDGRTVVLKNDLFPTKDTITKKAVEDAISKLVSVGLLIPYVDAESDMPYLMFRSWEKHQTIRNKYSKYPAPPDGLLENCKQMQTNCKQMSANCLYESESKIESESNQNHKGNARARTRFTPPTLDDVQNFAKEKGYTGFNAEAFVTYYESKGWVVGRSPMKDWQAAVRGWVSRDHDYTAKAKQNTTAQTYQTRGYTDADYGENFFLDLTKENAGGAG